eukprot:CAMPEP_0197924904 /NCGR_PEP_ID=MMETSP1439-20131203/96527_1 /TAXON_ID=66791 /ORGANISM="Gonyaulax spinifera, Strain CCMP409" /LENGTH=52 /DNA_ID=CAMNT_0043547359 /DNA_START=20 /DNA_END=178 /DNA_ORIENTATION=+
MPRVYDPLRKSMAPVMNGADLRRALGLSVVGLALGRCIPWRSQGAREPLIRG